MEFAKQQLSGLHVLNKMLDLMQLCLPISSFLWTQHCRTYQKTVGSIHLNLSIELIHIAGLFINVVRPANVSSHKLLPVVFVSVQMSQ